MCIDIIDITFVFFSVLESFDGTKMDECKCIKMYEREENKCSAI